MTDYKTWVNYSPIGKVHAPYKQTNGTPIQPSNQCKSGKIEVYPEFAEGLYDLHDFSHIFLLYHFNRIQNTHLMVTPFMDESSHGIFATRSPARPNKIGLSVLEIEEIKDNFIYVKHIDILNDTPVLDIKPYIPDFDAVDTKKIGWLIPNVHKHSKQTDDGRFL